MVMVVVMVRAVKCLTKDQVGLEINLVSRNPPAVPSHNLVLLL